MNEQIMVIAVRLEGEMIRRFLLIKNELGLQKNADLIRLLITEKYKSLHFPEPNKT